jgi:uncharacterized protein (DUF3084 family)
MTASLTARAAAVHLAAWFSMAGPAWAQAPAAKPTAPGAATAAAPAASAGRGFGAARGPMLTRDELRVCFKQEDELKKRLSTQAEGRAPLEAEKNAIAEEQTAVRAERAKFEGTEIRGALNAFNDRTKAFTERLARLEARVKAFNEGGRTATAAERDAIAAERGELEREREALEAERKRLMAAQTELQQAAQAHNERARALDARVVEWNRRNNAFNDTSAALDTDRSAWVAACGNRRYREEDEIAIRSGK